MTEQTAAITLSLLAAGRLSLTDVVTLYEAAGSALAVMENRGDVRSFVPEATDKLCDIMASDMASFVGRAEQEQQWAADNGVGIIMISDKDYPERLRSCHDAPLVLYTKGKTDLNTQCTLAVVGTRKCTSYGKDVIESIMHDLKELCPSVRIVSGLAYGVDICAHRAALNEDIVTVGVVAHGHDTLYPALHRNDANRMTEHGGAVITEYVHGTRPEARNFLQRNRIIAGLTDATLVVESASHGGGLVTARIAQDYGREVYAIPGPVGAPYSAGCNNMIRDQKAQLVSSAQDIVSMMNWEQQTKLQQARKDGIERSLFNNLSSDEQKIADALRQSGDLPLSELLAITTLPVSVLYSTLFSLEMRGIIRTMPGNTYHFIR